MKRKLNMFMLLMCIAFCTQASDGNARWYGNNHFRITQKNDVVKVAMSKMPWESFSVNLSDIISPEGFLSFEVKSENPVLIRVDGFTADQKQIELFSEHLTAGKFKELFYSPSSSQEKVDHLIIYINPGKQYKGEITFKGLRTVAPVENKLIKLFPNPTRGEVTVQLPDTSFSQVLLMDEAGNILHSRTATGGNAMMNLSEQKPGTYIIKARSGSSVITTRIIKAQ